MMKTDTLEKLLETINDTCPMIEAEGKKLAAHEGRLNEGGKTAEQLGSLEGLSMSLQYIEQLVTELAEAVAEATGNSVAGYEDGYEDGFTEGREEGEENNGYDEGYSDGFEDGKQVGLDEAEEDQ